jgi:putative phosphoesterase
VTSIHHGRLEIPLGEDGTVTIGVVADTHIPDRTRRLHPAVIPIFKEAGTTVVIHAGDVAVRSVLEELAKAGEVVAVRGNRDWALARQLPLTMRLQAGPVEIGLAHGHGGWVRYFVDKFHYLRQGYRAERYHALLHKVFPEAKVIVFGHTHRPECRWVNGTLFFNPGAAGNPAMNMLGPTVGLLKVGPGDHIEGKIIPLEEYRR